MKLIVGLGNIGEEFKNTRHNAGFEAIDFFCLKNGISNFKNGFDGEFAKEKDFIILKPSTFMNLSGISIEKIVQFYKIKTEDILIICDDIYLPIGKIRLRESGSCGGHNGLRNIIERLKTEKIKRIKIGVGLFEKGNLSDFVLKKMNKIETETLLESFKIVSEIISEYLKNDFNHAINLLSIFLSNKNKIIENNKNKVE